MLDGDGTFRHWKFPGAYSEQPWVDMILYRIIQTRWNELQNKRMQERTRSGKGARRGR
ncbi:MAG: hypothetical protein ACLFS5_01835 [Spirochaetaceae bacterium]